MEKTKYKIGEFSKLARVTVRTLRHYEDIGLLAPAMWMASGTRKTLGNGSRSFRCR